MERIHNDTPLCRWRAALLPAVVCAACASFIVAVHANVATYVCGNDPMLYIRAARTLLHPSRHGVEAVRHSLTFVAPGYPLFLAAAMRVFGELSPYWINAGVWIVTVPVLWRVLRRLMGSDRAAAFSLLATLWILFGGHPLHAPFLLYPFRETPRFFLVILSYALLAGGRESGRMRIRLVLASSVSLLAACAIREPSALVLPGLLAGLGGLSDSWRVRIRTWLWFMGPWLVAGVAAWTLLSLFSVHNFSQFSVMRYLGNHHVAIERAGRMMHWFPQRAGGWVGVALIAAGIVRAGWQSRILLAWFLLPSGLFFGFCAYMQMHDRYFLTALLFLVVFVGYGLDGVVRGSERALRYAGLREPRLRAAGFVLTGCVAVVLVAGLVRTPGKQSVWGPKVRAAEVREWQALVAGLEPSSDGHVRIAVEQRARYLEDMLLSYTDVEVLDPKEIADWPRDWEPAHYFRSLNRRALWATPQWLMYVKVYAHRLIEHRLDLIPVGDGEDPTPAIGAGRYARYRISRWRPGRHAQSFGVVPGIDHTLWLDFGASEDAAGTMVQVLDATTGEPWSRHETDAVGLLAVVLEGGLVRGTNAMLAVDAKSALPSQPMVVLSRGDDPAVFDLGRERRLSTNGWFPDRSRGDTEPLCPVIGTTGDLSLWTPKALAAGPLRWHVTLRGDFAALGPGWKLLVASVDQPSVSCDVGGDRCELPLWIVPESAVSLRLVAPATVGGSRHMDLTAIHFLARRSAAEEDVGPAHADKDLVP